MGLCVIISVGNLLVVIPFSAPHPGEKWGLLQLTRGGKSLPYAVAFGVLGLALDIYMFILPIPVII